MLLIILLIKVIYFINLLSFIVSDETLYTLVYLCQCLSFLTLQSSCSSLSLLDASVSIFRLLNLFQVVLM